MRINQIIEVKQELHNGVGVFLEGETLGLFDVSGGFSQALEEYDTDMLKSRFLGGLTWDERDHYNQVGSVYAQRGWGPAVYEAVMSIAPLAPHRHKVTSAAQNIWAKMAQRDDVEKTQHGAYQLTQPIDIEAHRKVLQRSIGRDPYGEKHSLLHEIVESTLSNAMSDIYSS